MVLYDSPLIHKVIRDWMPKLKDTELRVLLVVYDKTVGFGKVRDWISHRQFVDAIKVRKGDAKYCSRQISRALTTLISKYKILQAQTEDGRPLVTPGDRMKNYGKIYYLFAPQNLQRIPPIPVQMKIQAPRSAV